MLERTENPVVGTNLGRLSADGKLSPQKHNKYHARGIQTEDGYFHSQGEHRRWCDLKNLQSAGLIAGLRRQVRYKLEINGRPVMIGNRQAVYTCDFEYVMAGALVVEDYKGFDTTESKLRRAVIEAIYGFTIKITGAAKPSKG